jgi:hypothetical protein
VCVRYILGLERDKDLPGSLCRAGVLFDPNSAWASSDGVVETCSTAGRPRPSAAGKRDSSGPCMLPF